MFEKSQNKGQERGQVGIGTLIVFIALVLVAAIAAGVLINTAGFLQTQAQSTGEESTEQVSTNIIFLSTTGEVGADDENNPVGVIEFETTVQLGPGSSAVDLSETTVSVFTDAGDSLESNGPEVTGVDIDVDVLSANTGEDEATATLTFDIDDIDGDIAGDFGVTENVDLDDSGTTSEHQVFEPGTTVEVVLTTPQGTQAENSFIIKDPLDPGQLDGGEEIRLD